MMEKSGIHSLFIPHPHPQPSAGCFHRCSIFPPEVAAASGRCYVNSSSWTAVQLPKLWWTVEAGVRLGLGDLIRRNGDRTQLS